MFRKNWRSEGANPPSRAEKDSVIIVRRQVGLPGRLPSRPRSKLSPAGEPLLQRAGELLQAPECLLKVLGVGIVARARGSLAHQDVGVKPAQAPPKPRAGKPISTPRWWRSASAGDLT